MRDTKQTQVASLNRKVVAQARLDIPERYSLRVQSGDTPIKASIQYEISRIAPKK